MPSPGDMVQMRIMGTFDGEPVVNTLSFVSQLAYASFSDLGDAITTQADATLGIIAGGGDWDTGLSVQYRVNAVQVVDIYPGVSALYSRASAAAGTVSTEDAMPPNDALCCTLRSDFKGPGSRGRMYLTGFAEGSANGGYWEAGAQTYANQILSDLNNLFGEFGSGDFRWCILHRSSNGGVLHGPITPLVPPEVKPVMSFTVHNEVRSLGRRAVGRRIHRHRA